MKVLKQEATLLKKVELVFNLMNELGISINYMAGEYRITDVSVEESVTTSNLRLVDGDTHEPVSTIPPCSEYKLAIFE